MARHNGAQREGFQPVRAARVITSLAHGPRNRRVPKACPRSPELQAGSFDATLCHRLVAASARKYRQPYLSRDTVILAPMGEHRVRKKKHPQRSKQRYDQSRKSRRTLRS